MVPSYSTFSPSLVGSVDALGQKVHMDYIKKPKMINLMMSDTGHAQYPSYVDRSACLNIRRNVFSSHCSLATPWRS